MNEWMKDISPILNPSYTEQNIVFFSKKKLNNELKIFHEDKIF